MRHLLHHSQWAVHIEGGGGEGVTGGSENVSNFGDQGIPTEMRPWATQQLTKIRGDGGDLSLLDFLMNVTVMSDFVIY